jgi:hypothetical protein
MRRIPVISAVLGVCLAGAAAGALALAPADAAPPAAFPARHQVALASSRSCPASARGILPLRPDSVAKAARRALVTDKAPPGTKPGTEVMASARSAFAGARGGEVKFLCGAKVARRTVVVQLLFPWLLPSASLSQGVVFAGRFHGGYRVWYVAH